MIPQEEHDRRVSELLEANNREVERRRAAEARAEAAEAELEKIKYPTVLIAGQISKEALERMEEAFKHNPRVFALDRFGREL